ncbi:MAG TPA: hypothetical protein VGK67_41390 [Myxococcales bacterium]|jgi:hypothetical protein
MGFGDSFKKKVQDAAKSAVDKAVEKVAPPKPATKPPPAKAALTPARPAQNKPFPSKATPARAGASSGPMFDQNEKTVLDNVLQAKMKKQQDEEQEDALDNVLGAAAEEPEESDKTSAQKMSYGASADDGEAEEEEQDEEVDEDSEDDEQEEDEADDGEEDGHQAAYHQAAGGDLEFPVPVGWGVSDLTNEEFWIKVFDIEDAQMKGAAAMKKALKKYDLDSDEHFRWIRERFMARHAEDADFQQAMMNARMAQTRGKMVDAAGSELLAPIDGVSIETYATIQARRGKLPQQTVAAFGKLLAEYNLDAAKWAKVDKAWMARMSDPSDPMATAAVATEYGKYFAAAGQGQFGAAAKAGSKQLGVRDAVGKAPSGGEPCTFERYVEIMTAQSCWAQQGKDVNAMLKKAFKMDALDYSALASYWTPKMMADIKLMTEVMPKLQEKYTKRYSAPSQDDDLDI